MKALTCLSSTSMHRANRNALRTWRDEKIQLYACIGQMGMKAHLSYCHINANQSTGRH